MGKNVLLSYPHSGNHWVRFIIEYLTGYPTCGIRSNKNDVPIYRNVFPLTSHPLAHVNPHLEYLFYKSHKANARLFSGAEGVDSLLFLIRDYRECCLYRKSYEKITNQTEKAQKLIHNI